MKTKNFIKMTAIGVAVFAFSIIGCKKDKENNTNNNNTESMQQLSKDGNAVESYTGDFLNDANSILSNGNAKSIEGLPCNVTIDSSSIVGDTIIYSLTFNGLNCAQNHNRVGNATIKKHKNQHWHQAGTAVVISFNNLVITKVSSGKSITFNGTKTYENVTGGYLIQLGNGMTSIKHKITGSLHATFDDNTTRIWNVARARTFSGTVGSLEVTEEGFGSSNGYNKLLFWGTNRHGELFYTQINQAIVFKQACGWDPVRGELVHQIPSDSKKATITYGFDNNNQPVTPPNCPTRYQIFWEKGSYNGTIYVQLP